MASDYKLIRRSLTSGATLKAEDGSIAVQNFSEFMSYLNDAYLSQGYEVKSVQLLRYAPATEGQSPVTEYDYHLVKSLTE